jgi:hypothetical protein
VPAELEELAVSPHARELQDAGVDARQRGLGVRRRRRVLAPGSRPVGRRQRARVELAARGHRQRVEQHERGGPHRLGQPLAQRGAPRGGVRRGRGTGRSPGRRRPPRHDVADEAQLAVGPGPRDDGRLLDAGQRAQRRGHAAGLDAVAADLDLTVATPEPLEASVRQAAREVAGAIATHAACARRPGREDLRRPLRLPPVAQRDVIAVPGELAEHVGLRAVAIDQHRRHALDRQADGQPLTVQRRVVSEEGLQPLRALGRAESVDEQALGREVLLVERQVLGPRLLAAEDHQAHRGELTLVREPTQQVAEGRRRGVQDRHAQPRELRPGLRRHALAQRHRSQRGAVEQRAVQVHQPAVVRVGRERRERVARVDVQRVGVGADLREQAAVALHHALGLARRAGRVADVGQVVGQDARQRRRARRGVGRRVEVEHGRAAREPAGERRVGRVGHDGRGLGVLHHGRQPALGPVRIERDVGLPGEQRAHHGRGLAAARIDQQRHALRSADAARGERREQLAGQPARALLDLRVAPATLRRRDRGALALAPALRDETLADGLLDLRGGEGPVTVADRVCIAQSRQALPHLGAQQGQRGDRRVGVGGDRVEQRREVLEHRARRRGLPEIGVVVEPHRQAVRAHEEIQRQVELRAGHGLAAGALELQAGHARQVAVRHLDLVDEDLEQRVAAQVALGRQLLDQLLEGDLLVAERGQRRAPHAPQQLAEARPAGEVVAQHERVDEEADQALDLAAVAARDRRADDDVLGPRRAHEHHFEGGEQDHEERRALAHAELAQRPQRRGVDGQRLAAARRALHARPRAVGGQIERGRAAGQRRPPPPQLGPQRLALQQAALPARVVRSSARAAQPARPGGARPPPCTAHRARG